MQISSIVVVDTETTGLDPAKEGVVEVAAVHLRRVTGLRSWHIVSAASSLVNPGCPIPANVSAVHHITDDMVKDAPVLPDALHEVFPFPPDIDHGQFVVAAHNAPFDKAFLYQLETARWICTWRCANHLFPDAPGFGNVALKYHLKLEVGLAADSLQLSHRALPDTRVTAKLLLRMLETKTVEELLELSDTPIIQKTCRFGKWFGTDYADVPKQYLEWMLRGEFDADTVHTVKYWLAQK